MISLSDVTTINFTIDGNAAWAASNRFRIVFGPAIELPVAFSSVKAYPVDDKVKVDQKVQDEVNTIKYDVEKSITGHDFSIVNTTLKNTTGSYSWKDANAVAGNNFYRIKSINLDGTVKYSPVANVLILKGSSHFTVELNPVKGNTIHLHFANQPQGTYQFNLTNAAGQLVYSSKLKLSISVTSQELKANSRLPAGVYQLQIAGLLITGKRKK